MNLFRSTINKSESKAQNKYESMESNTPSVDAPS